MGVVGGEECEGVADGEAVGGELEVGLEEGERMEGEASLAESRVWDGESRVGEGEGVDEQEVEVDGAAFVLGVVGGASELAFDGLGDVEELEGGAVPVAGEGGVVEVWCVGDAVDGCGDDGGGASEVTESGLFEELAGLAEGVFGVAEVGAEGDGDVVGAGEECGREVVEGVEEEGGVRVGECETLFGGACECDAGHAGAFGGLDAG